MTHHWTTGAARSTAGATRRHTRFGRAAAALALLALVLPDRPSHAQTTDVKVGEPATVTLPAGARVEVYGGSGYILLKKAAGPGVVVSVVKSKLAADSTPVTMLQTPEGLTICAVYPAEDPKKPHACVPGGKGRIYDGNPQKLPDIGITVELPDGMPATANLGAGEVRSNAVTGDVTLYSDRGTVTVTDGGVGHIRANVGLLGNIQAGLARDGKQRRDVRLDSPGSGRVRVVAPRGLSMRYTVSTQRTPRIDPAFGIAPKSGLISGSTSPLATEVNLIVDTGIAGEFVLQQSAPPAP
ncbi:MAG TPA: hypothetical protein VM032_05890 [Vicinamibacterales bacterium]|nr:hypothetical protein [Vicinamibacterales bacterium]